MNTEQIEGKFERLKAQIKQTWGKLTDDEIMLYTGKKEEFLGAIKEKYGIAKEEAEKTLKTLEDATADKAA